MIKYKVKKGDENKEPCDKTIIKTGSEIEFTLQNIESDITYLLKNKKEMIAQLGIEEATKKNIEGTHPHVAAMSQEDLTAAYLYRQSTGYIMLMHVCCKIRQLWVDRGDGL